MRIRVARRSAITLATAGALASSGTLYVGVRNLLAGQADLARQTIPRACNIPLRADGVYIAGDVTVARFQRDVSVDLHLMIFGDSTGTGYGCCSPEEVPGALIARALAERTGKRVRLSTKAIVGATSKGLAGQVDAMFVAGPPPDAAVIMIGANDVTALNGVAGSAQRLRAAVKRLRASGAAVVVGTCPDFGAVSAIPQPLRLVAHARALQLARAQTQAVKAAGGIAVPFADFRARAFRDARGLLFAQDQYHPSAAGYALAAGQVIPALCAAMGEADSREVVPSG
jgi:lysophospholipase L1-like esterase